MWKNKSIIQECNVWGSSTRGEFEHPCPSSLWWHCTLNVLWCLFSSTPILCSDWGLKSTEDGHLEKFPGSVVPQRSLVGLLRSSARERQSREHYTNKDVSVFQASDTYGAMSRSTFSQTSPLLIIATVQNIKCACSWLGKECLSIIIRDRSHMSMESTRCTFSASVTTPTPKAAF